MKHNVLLDFSRFDFSDAHICDEHDLIHYYRMKHFKKLADEQLKMAIEEYEKFGPDETKSSKIHNAISIFAKRGAGKTTFLLSAISWLEKEHSKDVLCLKPIDPSMIGEKENAFVNIIAEIQRHVIDAIDNYDNYRKNGEEIRDIHRHIDNSFVKLMEALSFMDGIGKNGKYEEWDDAEYASRKGIEKASSSNNIYNIFQNYIYYTLKLLGKKCMVISFDDIDTDFNKGYEILEIIRRFLSSPMIITILTGDLELYGKLVRKASWKRYGKDFLEMEINYSNRKKQEFSTMIDQLENQYLIKILKPEYRIPLNTIKEYLEDTDFGIDIKFEKTDSDKIYPIESCYERLLLKIGDYRPSSKLSEDMKQFLLGQPLRIQIRLLTVIKKLKLLMQTKKDNKEELAEGILEVFWNDLNQKANNAQFLLQSSPVYTAEMLKFLDYSNRISTGCSFLPTTEDKILNNALFAIGSRYNQLVGNYKHLIFDYWCRISYTQTFYSRMPKPEMFSDFLNYSLLNADSGLVKSMGLMQAYYLSIPMMTDNPIKNIGIDELPEIPLSNYDLLSILAMLPSFGITDIYNIQKPYFSIYKLLALISNMMRFCQRYNINDKNRGEFTDKLGVHLSKLGQYHLFSMPNRNAPQNQWEEKEKNDGNRSNHFLLDVEIVDNSKLLNNLVEKFLSWQKENIEISCQSLHNIFVRFYYTMMHVPSNISIADKFNRYVLSLLNSVIVEAANDNGCPDFNMSNIGNIESIFMYNVCMMKKSIKNNRKLLDAFKFYNWLVSCPFLQIYIDPAVCAYISKDNLTNENMELWRHYHETNKLKKANSVYSEYLQNEHKKLKQKLYDISGMIRYNSLRRDLIRYESFRSSDNIDLINLVERKIEEYRQKINNFYNPQVPNNDYNQMNSIEKDKSSDKPLEILRHGDITVNQNSNISELEDMQVILSEEIKINQKEQDKVNIRITNLDTYLKRFGPGEYKRYEDEAYSSMDDRFISVYRVLEVLYPLYNKDGK